MHQHNPHAPPSLMLGAVVATICMAGLVSFLAASTPKAATVLKALPTTTVASRTQGVAARSIPFARQAPPGATVAISAKAQPSTGAVTEAALRVEAPAPFWTVVASCLLAIPFAAVGRLIAQAAQNQPEARRLSVDINDLVTTGKQSTAAEVFRCPCADKGIKGPPFEGHYQLQSSAECSALSPPSASSGQGCVCGGGGGGSSHRPRNPVCFIP